MGDPSTFLPGSVGGNPSGTQNTISSGTNVLGSNNNPLTASTSMPTGTNGVPSISALAGLNPAGTGAQTGTNLAGGNIAGLSTNSIVEAFRKAGYSSGDAYLIAQFLEGGAGYSPQVAQAMIAALGPSIEQGQANLLEQFGSQGLRMSSPAAYGMASFDSQVTLDEGQILSQLYEQSVQNYMNVIMAGKRGGTQPTTLGSILSGNIGTLTGAAGEGISAATSTGGSAADGLVAALGAL
jgi:hypothetical protein